MSYSISRRLVLGLTFGTALFWCIAAVGAAYVFSEELNETFDSALRETAQRLLPLAIDDLRDRHDGEGRDLLRPRTGQIEYMTYQVRDGDGRVLVTTPGAAASPPELYAGTPERGFSRMGEYRLYSDTDPDSGLRITVAEITTHRHEAIADSIRTLFWPLVFLVPLSALAIWLVVRSALRPVLTLRSQIALRDRTNLTPIDTTGQPDELKPIADAVARLIDRLRVALDAERAFAANSAHELRTPIAGALAQTQRLIAELDAGPARIRAGEIEQALKRLARLSEKLLQLSRVEAGIAMGDAEIDLLPALDLVVRDLRAELSDPDRLHYVRGNRTALVSRMDLEAFAIAIRNLIDNAIKHGPRDGIIEVGVDENGTVFVRNEGPVVPPDVLGNLKRRFARGDTGAEGTGLGLSIVDAIATQSGTSLELRSPATGQSEGFEARISL
jgi:two-component system OmpR family sensor kinase